MNSYIEYTIHDKYHRDDRDENGRVLPVYIFNNGSQFWYRNGKKHRDDLDENGKILPAIIWCDGGQEWYMNGKQEWRIK